MSSISLLEHKEEDDDDDNINEAHQDNVISVSLTVAGCCKLQYLKCIHNGLQEEIHQGIDPESCGASDSSSKPEETGHKDNKPVHI